MSSASTRGTHEDLDGIEAEGAHRVDLLAHLHRADRGGEGRGRAAGDDDRGQQDAELAQHRDGDQVDDEDLGAELAELDRAHVGEHDADQEGHQRGDRQRVQPRLLHVEDDARSGAAGRDAGHCRASRTSTAPSRFRISRAAVQPSTTPSPSAPSQRTKPGGRGAGASACGQALLDGREQRGARRRRGPRRGPRRPRPAAGGAARRSPRRRRCRSPRCPSASTTSGPGPATASSGSRTAPTPPRRRSPVSAMRAPCPLRSIAIAAVVNRSSSNPPRGPRPDMAMAARQASRRAAPGGAAFGTGNPRIRNGSPGGCS